MRRGGFVLREKMGVPFLCCTALERLDGFRHAFSTRHGGVPENGLSSLNLGYSKWDSPERVTRNRKRFLSALTLGETRLATLHQVHSNHVHTIGNITGECEQPQGDALITACQNTTLAVQSADCIPVLIADPVRRAIAAVHSGWRGTLARILPATIRTMQDAFGTEPADLVLALGPGIQACCFQIGAEVRQLFLQEYGNSGAIVPMPGVPDKYLLNLERILEIQCIDASLNPENCYSSGACTRCNTSQFFSYRAEGAHSGRMMAVICRHSAIHESTAAR